VADILASQDGLYDFTAQVKDTSVSYPSLGYRESHTLEDGSLYEGQWSEAFNCAEGAGVKVLPNGSLYEGFFQGG
jgi:hypothetical protein